MERKKLPCTFLPGSTDDNHSTGSSSLALLPAPLCLFPESVTVR